MAVQRERFQPSSRIVIPEPVIAFDLKSYQKAEWKIRRAGTHLWQRKARQIIRSEANAAAQSTVDGLIQQARRDQQMQQHQADQHWEALLEGECTVLTETLVAAFSDNPTPVRVLSAQADEADLELSLPGITVLPDRQPSVTPGGKLTTKAWTKTGLNDAYAHLLGAHLLATLREAWAVAPSLHRVRVRGIRQQGVDTATLLDQTYLREAHDWRDDHVGNVLIGLEGGLQRRGRTGEVAPRP